MPRYSARNLKHRNRKLGICKFCQKKIYTTQEEARERLGYLARRKISLEGAGLFAMQAYKCGAGWWHLGRNGDTVKRISKFLEDIK